jgi:hypothetical protein
MSSTLRHPRGNTLTESMPFTARDGGHWLVYIEGIPEPRGHWWPRATIPGRHLRFDSVAESRVTTELPAGSPFLADARLQDLLDRAHPVPLSPASRWQPPESPVHRHRAIQWAARAGKLGSAVLAAWSRRWREGAGRRQALDERAKRFLSAALDTALTRVARLASGRPRRARPEASPADRPDAGHSALARLWRSVRPHHPLKPR